MPTAAKTLPLMTNSRLASGIMMVALLPPNSRIDFPNRVATLVATCLPTWVLPVKLTNLILESSTNLMPMSAPPQVAVKMPRQLLAFKT